MSREPHLPPYPTDDARSVGYEVARTAIDAAVSVVPGAGYALGKVVEAFVAAPLQKRRDAWFEQLGESLREMESRLEGFDPAGLPENEDFISAVFGATQAAMKTGRQEKIALLRNGVLNIAAGLTIDDIVRGSFFDLVSRFTPLHVRVLSLLSTPSASAEMVASAKTMMMGAQMTVLRAAIPEGEVSVDIMSRVLSDLQKEGLAETSGLMTMGTSGSLLAKRATPIGDLFLRFVQAPEGAS